MSGPGDRDLTDDEMDDALLGTLFEAGDRAIEDCDYETLEEINDEIRELKGWD